MKLVDMTIRDFVQETASDAPAPGGGSVAAAAAALSTALGHMVYALTHKKKKFLALDAEIQAQVTRDAEGLQKLQEKLLHLVDEDTKAFNAFMAALKMPKETEEEQAKRTKAMDEAAVESLEIPRETARTTVQIFDHLQSIAKHGNKNAISDAGVSAELAMAAIRGAILNVRINLPSIKDEKLQAEAKKEYEEILKKADAGYAAVQAFVEEKL